MSQNLGTLVSTIDGVKNMHLQQEEVQDSSELSQNIKEYISHISKIAREVRGLGELERKLRKEFGSEILEIDGYRIANCFAVPGTVIRRTVNSIILPNGETPVPSETNMGNNVIDPIGWSSKVPAPSKGYGLLGKISQLRTKEGNPDFDERLHSRVMDRLIQLTPKGIALEVGEDEKAIMPLFAIKGADDLLSHFSDIPQKSDTPTAKYQGINS